MRFRYLFIACLLSVGEDVDASLKLYEFSDPIYSPSLFVYDVVSLNSKSSNCCCWCPDDPDTVDTCDNPLPTNLPRLPNMLGRNIAINTDFMICAPMNNGRSNFFKPNARNPSPNPVKNELFPVATETSILIY